MFNNIGHAAATLLLIFMILAISSGCESRKNRPAAPKPPVTKPKDPPTPAENKTKANADTLKALSRGQYVGLILALIAGVLAYIKKDLALFRRFRD